MINIYSCRQREKPEKRDISSFGTIPCSFQAYPLQPLQKQKTRGSGIRFFMNREIFRSGQQSDEK